MASFTDEVVNFTPYRPENPVEAMLQVGMTKQQQYMDGLQKIQTYVDTVGTLDVGKQEIKDYISGKLNSLHQNLNNVSGDFSDHRLVSQIGGAASKIASDPIVQNGIIATNEIRSGYQKLDAARKEGKSNPNNEMYFTDSVAKWQNDGQLDTKFSGQYVPYFDIVKKVRETYKDMNAGQDLPPGFSLEGMKLDQNGNPVFDLNYAKNMVLMEGISVDRVKAAVDLVMQDGNSKQQLMIDGYAKFRGYDGNMMFDAIVGSTQRQLNTLNSAIKAAQVKLGASTAGDKTQLINEINNLKRLADQTAAKADNYVQALGSNPEAVKSQIVEDELTNSLVGTFAYQKMVESPLWNQNLDLQKHWLEQQKFIHQQLNDQRNYELEQFKAQTAALKASGDKEGKGPNDYAAPLPVPNTAGQVGQATMNKAKEDSLESARGANYAALSEFASSTHQPEPYKLDPQTNKWVPNADGYGGGKEGTKKAIRAGLEMDLAMRSLAAHGTLENTPAAAFTQAETAYDNFKSLDQKSKEIMASVEPEMKKLKEKVGNRKDGTPYPADWFDAYSVEKGLPGSNAAEERLVKKYGEGWKYSMGIDFPTSGLGGPSSTTSRNYGEYLDFSKKMRGNEDTIPLAQTIENKFKEAQFAFQSNATIFDRSKDNLVQDTKTGFTAALTEQALVSPGGDAGAIKDLMNDDPKKQANDQYMAWQEFGPNGQATWWIGIQRGDDLKKAQVTEDAFRKNQLLQRAIPNLEFKNRFSSRLALRGGKDTYKTDGDINTGNGQATAYQLFMQPGNIRYTDENGQEKEGTPTVQYHLEEPRTARGKYRIKLYITDGKTGKVLVPGVAYPPADMYTPGETPALTQEQVMLQLDKTLSNPINIQGYLDRYYKKK